VLTKLSPDTVVLSGIGTVCREIEDLTTRVKRALSAQVLAADVPLL
jgi:hypothetical protein